MFLYFRFTLPPPSPCEVRGRVEWKFWLFVWHFPMSCLNFPRIRKSLSFLLKSFILIALFSFEKGGEEDTSKQNIHPVLFSYSSYFHGMKVDVYIKLLFRYVLLTSVFTITIGGWLIISAGNFILDSFRSGRLRFDKFCKI